MFTYLSFKRFGRLVVDDFLDEDTVGRAPVAEKKSTALNVSDVVGLLPFEVESFKPSAANSSTRQ